jgi:hypothetical protein
VQFDQLNRCEYRDLGAADRVARAGYAVAGKGPSGADNAGKTPRFLRFHRTLRQVRRWSVGHDRPPSGSWQASARRLTPAGRGAYTIRALPDLCFGIVSGRLGHLDPWIFFMVSTP